MPLYTQRTFEQAFTIRVNGGKVNVLCYSQFNESAQQYEIDYCDKVTKDTMTVNLPVLQHPDKPGLLMRLREVILANKA